MSVHVCCFSSLDDIPKRDRSRPVALLGFFRRSGVRRVSAFEMTQPIMRALKDLEAAGGLTFTDDSYPWHAFTLHS